MTVFASCLVHFMISGKGVRWYVVSMIESTMKAVLLLRCLTLSTILWQSCISRSLLAFSMASLTLLVHSFLWFANLLEGCVVLESL